MHTKVHFHFALTRFPQGDPPPKLGSTPPKLRIRFSDTHVREFRKQNEIGPQRQRRVSIPSCAAAFLPVGTGPSHTPPTTAEPAAFCENPPPPYALITARKSCGSLEQAALRFPAPIAEPSRPHPAPQAAVYLANPTECRTAPVTSSRPSAASGPARTLPAPAPS